MASVTITEILGSDSISGSRITINSNFLILQNWINGFESVFGINTSTGVMDLTGASTGRVSALTGRFNTISTPASGTALASINGSGAASFVSTTSQILTVSGASTFSGSVAIASSLTQSAGVTASFLGNLAYSGRQTFNAYASEAHNNNWSASGTVGGGTPGLTAEFPVNTSNIGGGGIVTGVNNPYVLTGTEDVIYANCGPTGFYMQVVGGSGGTASSLPAGFRVTVVNTATSPFIVTGITGNTSAYYTGFNTSATYGSYTGITFTNNAPYRSSVTLQWEPRIAESQTQQRGSWVIVNGVNVTAS
jgi:hypothetical protein